MVKGVQFLVDEHGEKTAVVIDLRKKKNAELWEDFYDRTLANSREGDPRVGKEATGFMKRVPVAESEDDWFEDQFENDPRFLERIERARQPAERTGRQARRRHDGE